MGESLKSYILNEDGRSIFLRDVANHLWNDITHKHGRFGGGASGTAPRPWIFGKYQNLINKEITKY
jgi:hypothetical protein